MSLFYCFDLGISATEEQMLSLNYNGRFVEITEENDSMRRNPPRGFVSEVKEDGSVFYSEKAFSEPSIEEKSLVEHYWVLSELADTQIALMYHWTDDPRATSTLDAWKLYARQLRDYTTTDEQGIPSIRGESRPVKPI